MMKSLLLSGVRLPQILFDAEKEAGGGEKSATELQREAIEVNISKATEQDEEDVSKEADAEVETKAEENKEAIEASKETQEELEEQKEEATTQEEKDKIQRRINREVAKRKALQTENEDLKKRIEALEADNKSELDEDEIEKRSEEKAAQKTAQREFQAACDRLGADAIKLDDKFPTKIQEMAQEVKPIPGHMIGILDDLENGGAVLSHLANNHDEYEDIVDLSPAKLALKLAKLSDKIAETSKPKEKKTSKLPAPIEPIESSKGGDDVVLRDNESMESWMAKRNQQIRTREERKRKGLPV